MEDPTATPVQPSTPDAYAAVPPSSENGADPVDEAQPSAAESGAEQAPQAAGREAGSAGLGQLQIPIEVKKDAPPQADPAAKEEPAREEQAATGDGSGGGANAGGGDGNGDGDGGGGSTPAPRVKRQAIVYLPGLRRDAGVESIEAVAHRVALAMDNNDPNATYSAATGETAIFAGDRARKASVVRKGADGKDVGVVDVYEFDYRGPLVDDFGKRSPLYQGLQVFATMAGNTRNFLLAIKRPGQSVPQKLQVLYGGMLMSSMLLYILLLLLTATATAKDGIVKITGADSAKAAAVSATAAANRARDSLKQLQARVGQAPVQPAAPAAGTAAVPTPPPGQQAGTSRPAPRGGEMRAAPAGKTQPISRADIWISRAGAVLGGFFGPALDFVSYVGEVIWELIVRAARWVWSGVAFVAGAVGAGLAWVWKYIDRETQVLQAGVATITVLGLAFRFNLKETLARTAGTTACISNYVAFGVGRPEIVGQMARLLEHLRADEKVEYTAVHVVGYSFGSVVAIDCIYQDSEVSPAFETVTSLTTIGCPADFIRTYWRDYFVDRHGLPSRPRWHNVHAPADVLASNFRDGPVFGGLQAHKGCGIYGKPDARGVLLEAEITDDPFNPAATFEQKHIVPSHYSHFGPRAPEGFFGWMLFILAGGGFKAHACYWPAGLTNAKTCWELVMERLDEFARIGKFPPPPPPAPTASPFAEPAAEKAAGATAGAAAGAAA